MDYDSGPYTVTFPAGETRIPFNVTINDDDIYEGNETFMLTIDETSLPGGVVRGNPGQATVTIVDDDRKSLSLLACVSAQDIMIMYVYSVISVSNAV